MVRGDEPPISRGVDRAIAKLALLRCELADEMPLASATAREEYSRLAPKLEHLDRFLDVTTTQVDELRELLTETCDLADRIRRR
jgi:hypothetical protein